ncbi:MAG: DUF6458 family protein [Aeromicrobium sp.]
MYIGGSLVLLAVGAVLSFAVADRVSGIDLVMVGYIFMVVGILGLLISLVVSNQHRDRRVDPPREPR